MPVNLQETQVYFSGENFSRNPTFVNSYSWVFFRDIIYRQTRRKQVNRFYLDNVLSSEYVAKEWRYSFRDSTSLTKLCQTSSPEFKNVAHFSNGNHVALLL